MADTLYNATTGVTATPNADTTSAQQAVAMSQGFKPIVSDTLGKGTTALNVPPPTISVPSTSPIVPPPAGVTVGTDGTASVPIPKDGTTPTSTQDYIKNQLLENYNSLKGKSDATTKLQNDQHLAEKTIQATSDYNAYNQAKLALQQQLTSMKEQSGGTTGGNAQAIEEASRKGNANLANLAVIAQSSQGLLTAAEKTINDKIDAQFKPLQDNIDFLTKFSQVNANDLSDSEKMRLQANIDSAKTDKASVQAASTDVHKTLLGANAPASAYSSLDKISEDFSAGKITSQQAQDQMYAAASPYAKNIAATTEKVTNADGSTSVVRIGNDGRILSTTNIGGATLGGGLSGGGELPSVQMTADGAPDPQSQQDFLSKLPKDVATLVQGISDYSINPTTNPQRQFKGATGLTQSQMLSLVKQYDPTYDEGSYAVRNALKKNFTSGKFSQNINALNTAVGHLVDLTVNSNKLGNVGFTPANFVINSIKGITGFGGNIKAAGLNINAATGELASVFKTGGATDQEIKNLGGVNTNSSPADFKGYIQTAINLLGSRLNALVDTFQSGMGKPPATSFLSSSNIQILSNLKNQGYDVNIKGIYFTDPIAYSKAKPENATALTTVRTQHPELTPAQATQLAQYLQENGQI